jgi:predicted transcriptional regulator
LEVFRKRMYQKENKMKTAEEIVNEMMEQTDEMLVEIHKNLIEKIGEAAADKWVEMLKQVREKEIEKQTK